MHLVGIEPGKDHVKLDIYRSQMQMVLKNIHKSDAIDTFCWSDVNVFEAHTTTPLKYSINSCKSHDHESLFSTSTKA